MKSNEISRTFSIETQFLSPICKKKLIFVLNSMGFYAKFASMQHQEIPQN